MVNINSLLIFSLPLCFYLDFLDSLRLFVTLYTLLIIITFLVLISFYTTLLLVFINFNDSIFTFCSLSLTIHYLIIKVN
jgi:hypothetical protein